jgi:hypothetical protein
LRIDMKGAIVAMFSSGAAGGFTSRRSALIAALRDVLSRGRAHAGHRRVTRHDTTLSYNSGFGVRFAPAPRGSLPRAEDPPHAGPAPCLQTNGHIQYS